MNSIIRLSFLLSLVLQCSVLGQRDAMTRARGGGEFYFMPVGAGGRFRSSAVFAQSNETSLFAFLLASLRWLRTTDTGMSDEWSLPLSLSLSLSRVPFSLCEQDVSVINPVASRTSDAATNDIWGWRREPSKKSNPWWDECFPTEFHCKSFERSVRSSEIILCSTRQCVELKNGELECRHRWFPMWYRGSSTRLRDSTCTEVESRHSVQDISLANVQSSDGIRRSLSHSLPWRHDRMLTKSHSWSRKPVKNEQKIQAETSNVSPVVGRAHRNERTPKRTLRQIVPLNCHRCFNNYNFRIGSTMGVDEGEASLHPLRFFHRDENARVSQNTVRETSGYLHRLTLRVR